ncbi:hypothetical protein AVEN_256839-1 [Araneus ventricosus]|uniref:Uncharacterized protein n=1 Tax=Araneus ventricosus TaxID=182803 RepID=A0A4Y2UH25_ARAVE|nr:hypothetical protein AVEN_256839-1 [Araneus ventricosus]
MKTGLRRLPLSVQTEYQGGGGLWGFFFLWKLNILPPRENQGYLRNGISPLRVRSATTQVRASSPGKVLRIGPRIQWSGELTGSCATTKSSNWRSLSVKPILGDAVDYASILFTISTRSASVYLELFASELRGVVSVENL